MQDLAFEVGHVSEPEASNTFAAINDFQGDKMENGNDTNISGITPEATHWNDYWRHHHMDKPARPELFDLRAPGQLVAVYLVYFVPLFVVGVCGWCTLHWPVRNSSGLLPLQSPCEVHLWGSQT